jgi:ribonuclease P protein component
VVAADEGRGHDRKLPRRQRLTRGGEIRAMLERGKRSRTAHLDVIDSASPVAQSRVGLVVPRFGGRAVDRNRLKRRLREIVRLEVLPRLNRLETGHDVLIRARRGAYGATWAELRAEVVQWLERKWPHVSS